MPKHRSSTPTPNSKSEIDNLFPVVSKEWYDTVRVVLEKGTLCQPCHEFFTHAARFPFISSRGFRSRQSLEKFSDEGCNLCSALLFGIDQGYMPQPGLRNPIEFYPDTTHPQTSLTLPLDDLGAHNYKSSCEIVIDVNTHLQRKLPGPHSLSEQSLSFVSRSIDQCISTHHICGKGECHQLPKRIISIGLEPGHSVKLIERSQARARYACLSHCWGNTKTIESTKENVDQHVESIAWDSLPRTYCDAITFCRALKIEYIWIDSLCIIQDDTKDWEEESSKMTSIYANSFITLAATGAPNHQAPCSSQLTPKYHLKEIGRIGSKNSPESFPILVREALPHPSSMIYQHLDPGVEKEIFPLLHRAWVYQERILSPRVLHFLPNELLWECKCRVECECRDIDSARSNLPASPSLPKLLLHRDSRPEKTERYCAKCEAGRKWEQILEGYVKLDLTYPKDKLPAMSGLARKIGRTRRDRYLAGLWESDMPEALFWQASLVNPKPPRPQVKHPSPTWSWASIVDSRVDGIYMCPSCSGHPENKFPIKFIKANVQPATVDCYGPVEQGAEVVISAKVSSATLRYRAGQSYYVEIDQISEKIALRPDYDFRYPGRYHVPDGATLLCAYRDYLEYTWSSNHLGILILRVVDEKEGKYERLGYRKIYEFDADYRGDLKGAISSIPPLTKTIRLV